MKIIVKLLIGTIILLYAIYGYFSGQIYILPSRHGNVEFSVSGSELVYYVLSYIAFSLVFYTWAFPSKYKRKNKVTRKGIFRLLKTPKDIMIAIFLMFGFILPIIGSVIKLTGSVIKLFE